MSNQLIELFDKFQDHFNNEQELREVTYKMFIIFCFRS